MTRAARRRAWRSGWRDTDWGEALRRQARTKVAADLASYAGKPPPPKPPPGREVRDPSTATTVLLAVLAGLVIVGPVIVLAVMR